MQGFFNGFTIRYGFLIFLNGVYDTLRVSFYEASGAFYGAMCPEVYVCLILLPSASCDFCHPVRSVMYMCVDQYYNCRASRVRTNRNYLLNIAYRVGRYCERCV